MKTRHLAHTHQLNDELLLSQSTILFAGGASTVFCVAEVQPANYETGSDPLLNSLFQTDSSLPIPGDSRGLTTDCARRLTVATTLQMQLTCNDGQCQGWLVFKLGYTLEQLG